jgi:hypothetical protein
LRANMRFRAITQNHTFQAECAVNAWPRRFPPTEHLADICSIYARTAGPFGLAARTAHITTKHQYDDRFLSLRSATLGCASLCLLCWATLCAAPTALGLGGWGTIGAACLSGGKAVPILSGLLAQVA